MAYALATVFAFGARWRGVGAAALLIALLYGQQLWLSVPGRQLFCERSGTSCDLFELVVTQLWPPALGVALGVGAALAARRSLRPGRPGLVTLALGLGVASLLTTIARLAIVPFVGRTPTGPSAADALLWLIAGGVAGAVALGLIIGVFSKRPVRDGIVIVLVYLGPWSPQVRYWQNVVAPTRGFVFEIDWQQFTPVLYAAAAQLAIGAGLVLRPAQTRPAPYA